MTTPLRSILAATDLGSGSDAVVRSAAILAQRTGAELHVLHSLELPFVPADETLRRIGFFEQIEAAEARLHDQVGRTMPASLRPASQKVIIYIAHKAILDRAGEVSADLVVVGPHRGGAMTAHFLGTTADRVIRTARVPCLVVEEPLADRLRRIGVPVDLSETSQRGLEVALSWALQLDGAAGKEGGESPAIRVMQVGWTVEQRDGPTAADPTLRPQLERFVDRAVANVRGAETLDVTVEVLWANNVAEATVRWAQLEAIDLLVLGTQGRSGLERALVGSVAVSVVRQMPRPVLLVPSKQAD